MRGIAKISLFFLLLLLKVSLAEDLTTEQPTWRQALDDEGSGSDAVSDGFSGSGSGVNDDSGDGSSGLSEGGDDEQIDDEKEDEHEKGEEIKDTEEILEDDEPHEVVHKETKKEEESEEELKEAERKEEEVAQILTVEEEKEALVKQASAQKVLNQTSPGAGGETGDFIKLPRMKWNSEWDVALTNLHPTGLRLGQFSSTWANLFWKAPRLPEHIIVATYSVHCFQPEFEHHLETVSTRGNDSRIRLSGLEMGTMYQCDVRAETNKGPSGWSAHLRFYPLPSALRRLGKAFHYVEEKVDRLEKQSAFCAYRGRWILPNKTITYDSLPLSHGLGSFDMASGEWTAEVGGQYVVSWDLYSHLFKGEAVMIRLYRRLAGGTEERHSHRHYSKFEVYSGMTAFDNIREQGGRTKIMTVREGESLFLRADLFTGEAFRINFCIHLLYAL